VDTINNLFSCCCNDGEDSLAHSFLQGTNWGFPQFQNGATPTVFVGATSYLDYVNGRFHPYEPMMKWLAVGAFIVGGTVPQGWNIKDGVESFSVGDLVYRIDYWFNRITSVSFYRCKLATSIGGNPSNDPNHFERYTGNRSLWLDTTWISLADTSPTGAVSYTDLVRYGTWTEVSRFYDLADVLRATYTRQVTRNEMTGAFTKVTDESGAHTYTVAIETMPSFSNPARPDPTYPEGFPEEYGGNGLPYGPTFDEEWNIADASGRNVIVRNLCFPDILKCKINEYADREDFGTVTSVNVTATNTSFDISLNIPWYRHEYRTYQYVVRWYTSVVDGQKYWTSYLTYTLTSSVQFNKTVRAEQTIDLTNLLVPADYVADLIALLPAVPDYGRHMLYKIDSTGSVVPVISTPAAFTQSYIPLYANNPISSEGNVNGSYRFGLFDDDYRFGENLFIVSRVKYQMYSNPHWSVTLAAGGVAVETLYSTAPLEHTFTPTDNTVQVVKVVTTDPSP